MYRNFLLPVGLLSGAIIGAGIFSLPFVFHSAGLSLGFFYLALGAFAYTVAHLMYADVIVRTPGHHRFVGYASHYLGLAGFWFAIFSSVVQMVFVLTIYLVLSQSFFGLLSSRIYAYAPLAIFWLLGSLGIFLSLRRLVFLEFLLTFGKAAIIFLIFAFSVPRLSSLGMQRFLPNIQNVLLPLSPVLFAFAGRVGLRSLVDYFQRIQPDGAHKHLRAAIIAGTLFSAVIYGVFALGVIALSGSVSEDAVSGLAGAVPAAVLMAIGALGVLSLFGAYIVAGRDVHGILRDDLGLPAALRVVAVVGAPILLYLSSFKNFIGLVSLTGGIFLSIEGILIVAMWRKANALSGRPSAFFSRPPRFAMVILVVVFAAALMYEIVKQ